MLDSAYLDPNLLTTVGGIVTLTISLVEALKRGLAHHRTLNALPTWLYGLIVASLLTWGAHELRFLEGDLRALLGQAVLNALVAFGVMTVKSNFNKPIGDSEAARRMRSAAP